jgi:hypothetical protein
MKYIIYYVIVIFAYGCNSYHNTYNRNKDLLDKHYSNNIDSSAYLNGNVLFLSNTGNIISVQAIDGFVLPFSLKQYNSDSVLIDWEGACYNQEAPITYSEILRSYSLPIEKEIDNELFHFTYFNNGTKKVMKYSYDSLWLNTFIQPFIEIEYRKNRNRKRIEINGIKIDTIIQFNYKGDIKRITVIKKKNDSVINLPTKFYSVDYFDSLELKLQIRISELIKRPCIELQVSPILNPQPTNE